MTQEGFSPVVGASASLRRTVAAGDTAVSWGSGDVPVLATPRLLAWLEETTVLALHGIPEDLTSVGTRIVLQHRRPSAVGEAVECTARVVAVDGRSVELAVQAVRAADGSVLADGTVERALVDRTRFLKGLAQ